MRTHALAGPAAFALVLCLGAGNAAADTRQTVNAGLAAFQAGDTDKALALLSDAINSRDLSGTILATAYYDRGGLYLSRNDLEKALADADKAIALSPGYGEALKMRGTIHFAKGDMDAAIADLHAAQQLLPGDDGVHVDLGNALRAKGDSANAIAE